MRAAIVLVVVTLAGLAGPVRGQEPASQPTTREISDRLERLNDLLALIEGQTTPEVRLTIARELLLQGWPETPPRLAAVLAGTTSPARIAVATALAERPATLDPAYVEPLLTMLGDADAAVRQAAAAALAAYPDNGVAQRLRDLVLDAGRPRVARLAGLSALGLMPRRAAIEILAAALDDQDIAVAYAALAALAQVTALDFGDDLSAARAWWAESSTLPVEAWQQRQIERLVRRDRELRRRLEATETRLARVLEANFLRAAETERVAALTAYLADAATSIRLLGLRFAQLHMAEGKSLPAELQERIRNLTGSGEAREAAAAVQTVASFREAADADRFLAMLSAARAREVRLALLNGLGYVGSASATEVLLATLNDPDEACATEAVTALGRLAERGVLGGPLRDTVVASLLGIVERAQAGQVALRERVLWAMGNMADPRCGLAFAAALGRQEAVVVRQAAVRGLAALRSAQWGDVLAAAADDPDAGVRKVAVETLALVGHSGSDRQLSALWERAVSAQEPDESLRQTAFRGLVDSLAEGGISDIERWLDQLVVNGAHASGRLLDLLERLVRLGQDAEPVEHYRLGLLRARLGAQRAKAGQPVEAVAAYVAALADLEAARADAAGRVAGELLRTALRHGCYDETVATALLSVSALAGGDALWQVALGEIETQVTAERLEEALAMIAALERHPPAALSDTTRPALEDLRRRVHQHRPASPGPAPATPSASTAPAASPR